MSMKIEKNIQYNEYKECVLDFYIPDQFNKAIILFHGGGLNSGSKDDSCYVDIAKHLCDLGYFVVEGNYRMLPIAKHPDYIEDVADAVKYVFDYMKNNYKGVSIFVGGHSAGAYLSIMLAMNSKYLDKVGLDITDIKGWLIDSAQMTTHFNVLSSLGLSSKLTRIDESSALYFVDENMKCNNILLLTYENDIICRKEQNYLFYKSVKWNKGESININIQTLPGDHCSGLTTYDKDNKSILVGIFDKFIKSIN